MGSVKEKSFKEYEDYMEEKYQNNQAKTPNKKVITFLAEVISELLNNMRVHKEEKEFLQKVANNLYFCEYIKFNSDEYKKLQEEYNDYLQHANKSGEAWYLEQLLKHLKVLVSNYEILHNNVINVALSEIEERFSRKANSKIKELDKTIKENLIKSGEMLGDIADNSNAKRYLDYARKNRKSARWLFWFSLFLMLYVAYISKQLLWNIENLNEFKLLVRIPLTFLILLSAFFMMRESKKLKDKEFQYYDMACRIITSSPYIDGLHIDEKEKDKLKADLVKDFFGRPIECRDDGGLPPIENICEIIKACLDKKNN